MNYVEYVGEVFGTHQFVGDAPPSPDWLEVVPCEAYTAGVGAVYFTLEGGKAVQQASTRPTPNHTFNYTTKQWEDPRTLQDLKDTQWALIKQARSQAEYAGFTWDGSTFDSDTISQNRITGAVTLAQLSPAFTIDWTLQDNTVRTLNQTQMLQVGAALGVHVQTQFAKGQALRAQIDAATTQAEVDAVAWY